MAFEDNKLQKKVNVTVVPVTSIMLTDLLEKVKLLDETGAFEIDHESLNKLDNFKTYISYFTSLKKLAELREHSKNKRKPSYLIHLENFKRGLMFLLRIPDNNFIIGQQELRLLGKYLKKTNKDDSAELNDIVKSWAKYGQLTDKAVRMIDKKHEGFIDFFKGLREFKVFLFNYILENEKNISEIIDSLKNNNSTYIINHNNFFSISDIKEEKSTLLNDNEIPLYIIAYFLEISKRDKIEELDILNAQKNAMEIVKKGKDNIEINEEKSRNDDYITSDNSTNDFFNEEETRIETPIKTPDSLDDFEDDGIEIPVINRNKPSIFITVVDTEGDFQDEVNNTVKQWERLGIDNSQMKRDLALTLLAYIKRLSNDLTEEDKEKINQSI